MRVNTVIPNCLLVHLWLTNIILVVEKKDTGPQRAAGEAIIAAAVFID